VPGEEGDFGVLAGHAPFVATLRPGVLTVYGGTPSPTLVVVRGGFAEVGRTGLTILAEMAVPMEEFDRARLDQEIKDAAHYGQKSVKIEFFDMPDPLFPEK